MTTNEQLRSELMRLRLQARALQNRERYDEAASKFRESAFLASQAGFSRACEVLAYMAECCDDQAASRNEAQWEASAGVEHLVEGAA